MKMKNYKNSPTTPFHMSKKEKNSNLAVFEIANNFIARIQFPARRLTTKKLVTLKAPRNTPKTGKALQADISCIEIQKKFPASQILR